MASIFIASTGNQAGQTLIAWSIARVLKDKGLEVGFLKPRATHPAERDGRQRQTSDTDALLMSEVLGLTEPPETICPHVLAGPEPTPFEKGKTTEILERIKGSFHEISKGKDLLIIMGSQEVFFDKALWGLSDGKIVEALNAGVILIHRHERESRTLYSLLSIYSFLGDTLKGVVINRIPPESLSRMEQNLIPFLKEKGIKVLVSIPEDPVLRSMRLQRIVEYLDGEVLCWKEKADTLVARYTIGSTSLDEGLDLFKRVYNKIVLIGLPPSSVCGILITGGRLPSEMVIQRAESTGIPLVLVREDTFETLDRLQQATLSICRGDAFKVNRLIEIAGREKMEELLRAFSPV